MGGDFLYHFVRGCGDSDKSSRWLTPPYSWKYALPRNYLSVLGCIWGKKKQQKTYVGFVDVTSLTLLLFLCSDDSFADREMLEIVMSIDQYLIISLTVMTQQYS